MSCFGQLEMGDMTKTDEDYLGAAALLGNGYRRDGNRLWCVRKYALSLVLFLTSVLCPCAPVG